MIDIVRGLRRIAEEGYRFAGDAADEIERLRASLEEAEAECFEQARLNGMGSEREAALMAKLEVAERERDRYWQAYSEWIAKTEWVQEEISSGALPAKYLGMHRADAIKQEIDRLRVKIEAMERQKPVAFALYSGWVRKAVYLSELEACEQRDRRQLTADLGGSLEAYRVVPLYTSSGAKGEEK